MADLIKNFEVIKSVKLRNIETYLTNWTFFSLFCVETLTLDVNILIIQ